MYNCVIHSQPLWECMAAHKWTDEQLAILQKDLEGHDLLVSYKKAMYGERLFAYVDFERMRAGRATASIPSYPRLLFPFVNGFLYQNELAVIRSETEWTDDADFDFSKRRREAVDYLSGRNPYNILASMLLPALGRSIEKAAYAQGAIDLARSACALERYRLANGAYPADLAALVPQYAAAVPKDIIDGQPLKYRRTGDGIFVLYSIGLNKKDDGGTLGTRRTKRGEIVPSLDWNSGDWVWTYKKLVELGDQL